MHARNALAAALSPAVLRTTAEILNIRLDWLLGRDDRRYGLMTLDRSFGRLMRELREWQRVGHGHGNLAFKSSKEELDIDLCQRGALVLVRQMLPRNVLTAFIRDVIKPLTPQFPTAVGEIRFEHGRLHSFRHFFRSVCLISGASEGEVREWLGHADSKTVEHYRHLRAEDARRRMDQIHFLPAGIRRPSTEQLSSGRYLYYRQRRNWE